MDKQTLSIAMCTYKGAQYLQEQLDSIDVQTRLPDELVICDDRSSDNTREIIKYFESKISFPLRLYLNEENLGLCKNREKAISLCKGDIIVFCDQDDVWKQNKLERIMTAFTENLRAGYVFSNAELIDEASNSLGYTLWEAQGLNNLLKKFSNPDYQVKILLKRNPVWGATLAFRSSLKELILPMSPFCVEDAWIALLSSCAGFYGIHLSDSLLYYRQHAEQQAGGTNTLSQKLRRARNPKEIEIFKKLVQGLLEVENRLFIMQKTFDKDISVELNLVRQKAEHFSKRISVRSSNNILLKTKEIYPEVLTGKYNQFSNSWQSIAKDLLF